MSDGKRSNGNDSDTRYRNAQNKYDNLTEAEFLAHEADLAKTAMSTAFGELKANLARAADIKLWAHHYPWLTVGVAAASGFTLAGVVRGGGQSEDNGPAADRHHEWLLREEAKAPLNGDQAKSKVGESLLGSLFSLARTALEASLVSSIRQQAQQPVVVASNPVPVQPTTPSTSPDTASV
jgi:ElaB/YqjD/DUF883 family membrane-anchored ribosome-binding protein